MDNPTIVQAITDASKIIMQSRIETLCCHPVHDKLCRISEYLEDQVTEILKEYAV